MEDLFNKLLSQVISDVSSVSLSRREKLQKNTPVIEEYGEEDEDEEEGEYDEEEGEEEEEEKEAE